MAEKEMEKLKADIKAEKKEIKAMLLNDTAINEVLDTLYYGYTDLKDITIKENVKSNIDTMLLIEHGKLNVDVETQEEIEKKTHRNFWEKETGRKAEYYKSLLDSTSDSPISERQNYIKLVEYITGSQNAKNKKQKAEEIINSYGSDLLNINDTIATFIYYYLREEKKIEEEQANKISVLSFLTGDNLTEDLEDLRKQLLEEIEEENLKYVGALADITASIRELIEKAELKRSNRQLVFVYDVEKEKEQKEIIPRFIYSEEMLISHSEYISTLVKNGFQLDKSVFSESEETLKKLNTEDNDILDLLILNWYDDGVRRFTDRQLAIALYHGGDSNADVSKEELQKINDSIDRLRKTDIKQGIESIEKIDSTKLKITETTTLISVIVREIEHAGNTTVYDFTGVQGFYEYAQVTKKISKYSNALITADIKGLQHDFKNDTLRRLIVRRIKGLDYKKHTAIDMREVYEVLEIKDPRNYTYAKNKVKSIIKELRYDPKKEKDIYYNFSYEFKKRNKATILTFTASTDQPLEMNKKEKDGETF